MKKLLILISVFTGILLFLFSCGNINNEVIIDGLVVENDELVSIGTFNNEKLVIPAEIKRVREGAFEGAIFIKEIEVPFEDFSLNYCVFKGCLNVTKLTIPVLNGPLYNLFGQDIDSLPKSLVEVCLTKDKEIERDEFSDCSFIKKIILPLELETIENGAFENCSSLTEVIIPDNVQTIGSAIFEGCTSITKLTIPYLGQTKDYTSNLNYLFTDDYENKVPQSLKEIVIKSAFSIKRSAFEGCSSLTSITLPNDLNKIGYSAFRGCSSLKTINIPDSVVEIEECAFADCTSLTNLTLPKKIEEIKGYTFSGCSSLKEIIIPEGVKSIGYYAFSDCSSLETVVIPNSVEDFDNYIFNNCKEIKNLTIPFIGRNEFSYSNISFLGEYIKESLVNLTITNASELVYRAFAECKSLEKVYLNEGIQSITEYSFFGCSSLVEVSLPATVTKIKYNAFDGCESLEKINFSNSLKIIEESAFNYCESLKEIILPDSLEEIGEGAFSNCDSLLSITFPKGIKELKAYTFGGCNSLQFITVPENIKVIGERAFAFCASLEEVVILSPEIIEYDCFYNCENLTKVVIGEGIKTISNIFYSCSSLEEVVFPNTVEKIEDEIFVDCPNLLKVTVPFVGTTKENGTIASWFDYNQVIPIEELNITDSKVLKVRACEGASNLKKITFPEGFEKIERYAFSRCTSLKQITIPETVTSIGTFAFSQCKSLERITLPSNLQVLSERIFDECERLDYVTIPKNITQISSLAFKGCSSLKNLEMPSTITKIGEYAFEDCTSLYSIDIPRDVKTIGSFAFADCTSLKIVYFPEDLELIGTYAFDDCTALEVIKIPGNVTVERGSFSGCSNLKNVYVGLDTFIDKYVFTDSKNIVNIYFQGENKYNLDGVADNIYYNCLGSYSDSYFKYLILDDFKLKIIESYSSSDFPSISVSNKVKINGTYYVVEEIENAVNSKATNVNIVNLPNTVKKIDSGAFGYYKTVEKLYYNGTLTEWLDVGCSSMVMEDVKSFYLKDDNNQWYEVHDVVIPESVTKLSLSPILGKWLTSLTIPNTVEEINSVHFGSNITYKMYYLGTIEDWCKIDFIKSNPAETASEIYFLNENNELELVEEIIIPETITEIKPYAFYKFKNITTISLPNSLEKIGERGLHIRSSVTQIKIPSSVQYIDYYGVNSDYYDRLLILCESDTKPEGWNSSWTNSSSMIEWGVKGIFSNELYEGLLLTSNEIILTNYLGTNVFVHVPEKMEIDGETYPVVGLQKTFKLNKRIVEVYLPDSVKIIGDYAFYHCSGLEKISFNSVVEIGEYAFYECSPEMKLPNTLKKIGDYAFGGCSYHNLIIPDSVTFIGEYFLSKSYVNKLTVPFIGRTIEDNRTVSYFIGWEAIVVELIVTKATAIVDNCFGYYAVETVHLPKTIKEIGRNAFTSKQTSVYFDVSLEECFEVDINSIPKHGYKMNIDYNNVVIPEGVTKLGKYIFGNVSVYKLYLPKSIEKIEKDSLYHVNSIYYDGSISELLKISEFNIVACCSNFYYLNENNEWSLVEELRLDLDIINYDFLLINSNFDKVIMNKSVKTIPNRFNINLPLYYEGTMDDWVSIDFGSAKSNPLNIGNSCSYFYYLNENNEWIFADSITISEAEVIKEHTLVFNADIKELRLSKKVKQINGELYFRSLKDVYYEGTVADWCGINFTCQKANPGNFAEKVYLLDENNEWYLCDILKVTDDVDTINAYAFYNWPLDLIFIPDTVEVIGEYALAIRKNQICFQSTIKKTGWHSKYAPNYWPDYGIVDVLDIEGLVYLVRSEYAELYMYRGTKSNVDIPEYLTCHDMNVPVTSIGFGVFRENEIIQSVSLTDKITKIGSYAFYECPNLADFDVPKYLESVGDYGLTSLSYAVIPSTLEYVGYSAFTNCTICLNLSNKKFDKYEEEYWSNYWCNDKCHIYYETQDIVVVEDAKYRINLSYRVSLIEYFGESPEFVVASSITYNGKVYTVKEVGVGAFNRSKVLRVILNDNITTIKGGAFSYCSQLLYVYIPKTVTTIELYAFEQCDNLIIHYQGSQKYSSWHDYWHCGYPVVYNAEI